MNEYKIAIILFNSTYSAIIEVIPVNYRIITISR